MLRLETLRENFPIVYELLNAEFCILFLRLLAPLDIRGGGVTTLPNVVWAMPCITSSPPGNLLDPPDFFGDAPTKFSVSRN